MRPTFMLQPKDDGTSVVSGELWWGLNDIKLDEGDSLEVTAGSDTVVMVEGPNWFGNSGYTATLPTNASGTPVTVSLKRPGNVSATLTATIPSRLNLTPIVVPNGSRANAITLAWDTVAGTGETMGWEASGDCISDASAAIPAGATTATIPGGTLKNADENLPETCKVSISVWRATLGSVDPSFASGSLFNSIRSLSSTLTLGP